MKPINNKFIFYFLSFTWGLPLTLIGLITTLVLIVAGKKPHRYLNGWYFEVGNGWGGLEMGPCFLVCKEPSYGLLSHEYGHGIQNCYFGPTFIFVIWIPSAVRYWFYDAIENWRYKHDKKPRGYYDIWFEHQASEVGEKAWAYAEYGGKIEVGPLKIHKLHGLSSSVNFVDEWTSSYRENVVDESKDDKKEN